jgi:anti-sigma B factor antagonist
LARESDEPQGSRLSSSVDGELRWAMPPTLDPNVPVVALRGELDLAQARSLGTQLGELAGQPGTAAVLDLTDVTFMDSTSLGVVMKAAGRFRRQAKRFVIVAPAGPVLRLLEISGVGDRLALAATREEAVAAAGVR